MEVNEAPEYERTGIIGAIISAIWTIISLPFRLLMAIIHILNEVRGLVVSIISLFIFVFVALTLTVVFKPAFAWEPLKDFLNAGVVVEEPAVVPENNIYIKINNLGPDNQEVVLSNAELTVLFSKYGTISNGGSVEIKENGLRISMNTDIREKPLWFFVNLAKDSKGNLKVDNVTFGRFALPEFVANWTNSSFGNLTNMIATQVNRDNTVFLFNQLLDKQKINNSVELTKVDLYEGRAVLKFIIIGN